MDLKGTIRLTAMTICVLVCAARLPAAEKPGLVNERRVQCWAILLPETPRGVGPTIEDRSGNGRDGKVHNAGWVRSPKQAEVAFQNGRAMIVLDKEPLYPMIYALTQAGRHTWQPVPHKNLENFARAGFRLYQIDVSVRRHLAAGRAARSGDACPANPRRVGRLPHGGDFHPAARRCPALVDRAVSRGADWLRGRPCGGRAGWRRR